MLRSPVFVRLRDDIAPQELLWVSPPPPAAARQVNAEVIDRSRKHAARENLARRLLLTYARSEIAAV